MEDFSQIKRYLDISKHHVSELCNLMVALAPLSLGSRKLTFSAKDTCRRPAVSVPAGLSLIGRLSK